MSSSFLQETPTPEKFAHPTVTAKGEERAWVALQELETLWFNTGTLCNIACENCYIESTPSNDRLSYLTVDDVLPFLDEIRGDKLPTREIGLTGGEPFMNPSVLDIMSRCLEMGFRVLVLTNAMEPMQRQRMKKGMLGLQAQHGREAITLRVSLDHYDPEKHDQERGVGSYVKTLQGLRWLRDHGFRMDVAGRTMWGESESSTRRGFARLFDEEKIPVPADALGRLILFPEMDEQADVPEITTACWGILDKSPADVMCASSRMVVKRRGQAKPKVLACTLLPYDEQFELGETLAEASGDVRLNHPHCAKFCVLGGGSCTG